MICKLILQVVKYFGINLYIPIKSDLKEENLQIAPKENQGYFCGVLLQLLKSSRFSLQNTLTVKHIKMHF